MKIFSVGNYYSNVQDSPPPLKALLKEETGNSFRRIDRFIQLALIGVARCVKSLALSSQTSVYFTSGQGDLDITIDVLERLYQHNEPPKPLSFINTVSNAACFTIANYLGLEGKSNFVTGHYFAFERVLELAYRDSCLDTNACALVGSVDICAAPLSQHRERIGLDPQCLVAEGSHWWLLAEQCGDARCIGELLTVENFSNEQQLRQWLTAQSFNSDWFICAGQYLTEKKLLELQQYTGIARRFDYCSSLAFYNTQSGAVLYHFLQANHRGTLLHINADLDGRYCLFVLCVTV